VNVGSGEETDALCYGRHTRRVSRMDSPANGAVDSPRRASFDCDRRSAGNRRCGKSDANARCDHVDEKSKRRTSAEAAVALSAFQCP